MRKRIFAYAFLSVIALILFASLVKALFIPREINDYENRYSNRISPFSAEAYLSGAFQESMESGLADQVLGAQYFKRFYNLLCSAYTHTVLNSLDNELTGRYVTLGDKTLFNGYLVYPPVSLYSAATSLDAKAANYSKAIATLPDVEFYFYYIERDRDINFATGEKAGLYEYLRSGLALPEGHIGRLKIDSFDEYAQRFYATDHHRNHRGSYQGYTEILSMLLPKEAPLVPQEEIALGAYSGTKSAGKNGETYSEPFSAYRFDFPPMSVCFNGEYIEDYGTQTELSGRTGAVSYVGLYGADAKEIIFDAGNENNGNLLIIGDSNDNAIVKLLASHFDRSFSVDLRHYSDGGFKLEEYLRANDIGKVLFVGNSDFYTGEAFLLGY